MQIVNGGLGSNLSHALFQAGSLPDAVMTAAVPYTRRRISDGGNIATTFPAEKHAA